MNRPDSCLMYRRVTPLTDRQRRVCEMVRQGHENKEISHELGVDANGMLQVIFWKLGVRNRAELAGLWTMICFGRRRAA